MKKFLSVILAAMVITAAGCGEKANDETTTTTPAAADDAVNAETTDAGEEAEATEADDAAAEEADDAEAAETTEAAEEAPAGYGEFGVDTLINEEMAAFIDALKEQAPIYADYMVESSVLPTAMGFAYEADLYGTGTPSVVTMEVYMSDMATMAVNTSTDGVASNIIIKDNAYYIVSPAESTAIYMALSEEEAAQMADSMTASVQPAFSLETATIEAGTTEFNGAEYLYEKITTAEAGDIVIYADPATKEIKYLTSAGITMELTFLTHDIDASVYEIPADYTVMDMAELAGAAQ